MVVKQIYSIVNYNEAVQVMDAGADHIGLVPMQSGEYQHTEFLMMLLIKFMGKQKKEGLKQ